MVAQKCSAKNFVMYFSIIKQKLEIFSFYLIIKVATDTKIAMKCIQYERLFLSCRLCQEVSTLRINGSQSYPPSPINQPLVNYERFADLKEDLNHLKN